MLIKAPGFVLVYVTCRQVTRVAKGYLNRATRKPVFGVSDTNWAVQPQTIVQALKFRILEVMIVLSMQQKQRL